LPFAGHRHHLVVTAVVCEPLQSIAEREMRAEGFAGRNAWVDAWDREAARHASGGAGFAWSDDPAIPVIDIVLHKRPAPVGQP
jgi:hypothetical protein